MDSNNFLFATRNLNSYNAYEKLTVADSYTKQLMENSARRKFLMNIIFVLLLYIYIYIYYETI